MNFDDLHDPDPPCPGPATLAAVAERARQLRRRRAAFATTAAVLAAAAIVVPTAIVVSGGDRHEQISTATVPDGVTTTVPEPAPTTTVGGPPTTWYPTTSGPPMPPTTRAILPGGPPTTAATGSSPTALVPTTVPGTSLAATAATTSTVPRTTVPTSTLPSMVMIGTNGDAVSYEPAGVTTLLSDGADPSARPTEGELTLVDSAVVTPSGRVFVSTCCEPVPGTYQEIVRGTGPIDASLEYGHGIELSPDGARLAAVGASTVDVRTLDGAELATAGSEASGRTPYAVAWVGDGSLAVLETRQAAPGAELRLIITDAGLAGYDAAPGVVLGTDIDAPWPRLAGVADDGSVLVFVGLGEDVAATTLQAYDPITLQRRPASDVTIPAPAAFAWQEGGLLTWIGVDGSLHVGDHVVPGEFRWARPAG